MDDSASPLVVAGTVYEAHGLEPQSEHSFRLAYVMAHGERSLLSDAGRGATLAVPGAISEPTDDPGEESTSLPPLIGSGVSGNPGETSGTINLFASMGDGVVALTWNTTPGKDYQVQNSTDYLTGFDLGEPRRAATEHDTIEITPKERAAFFRVLEMP
jgi:hypothetical protein